MKKIKVLVADDSKTVRDIITAILSQDDEIEIVGKVSNGREAVEFVKRLKPDIITMDMEMPVMNGLEATEKIMKSDAVPIVIISDYETNELAYKAISCGALEVLSKSSVSAGSASEFIQKVKLLSKVKVIRHIGGKQPELAKEPPVKPVEERRATKIVAIASSTGGPNALSVILRSLPEDFSVPILIAQHIEDDFVQGLIDWLNGICQLNVLKGIHGKNIAPGNVYISPTSKHMQVNGTMRIGLVDREEGDFYHPSCNVLLSSVAKTYGKHSIGVILTGMGSDGAEGIKEIKAAGGTTIAQDEETSIIFGMPSVAIENGGIDIVLPLEKIAGSIARLVRNSGK